VRLRGRTSGGLGLAILALATLPPPATADVDPASDVLLLQDVFTPQSPPARQEPLDELRATAAAARKAGFPLKTAVIGSRTDLGGIPQLFGQPQKYARFLGTELTGASGRKDQPLLVVMANGFGTFSADPKATAALRGVKIEQGGSDDLVQTATAAIPKMAEAVGHPIGKVSTGKGGGGGAPAWVFVVPVLLLAAAGLIYSQRGRREELPPEDEEPAES
jgi:hypothetical protein